MKIIALSILLFAIATAQSQDLRTSDYTVLAVQYVGIIDKPVFPIVISDSKEGAEWFRTAVLKQKNGMSLTHIHVVDDPLMAKLIKETKAYIDVVRKDSKLRLTSSQIVSITLTKAGERSAIRLSLESAAHFLENLMSVCGGNTFLYSDLQEFQERVRIIAGGP
jgi:hypothetical protein